MMKAEFQTRIDRYQNALRNADKAEQFILKEDFDKWYLRLSDNDRAEMHPYWEALGEHVDKLLIEAREMIVELQEITAKEKRGGLAASASGKLF